MKPLEYALELFEALGGKFITPIGQLAVQLEQVRALVFDWDGVFNDGAKGVGQPSVYNEVDTAGINALRFGLFLATGQVPAVAVISGQQNESAVQLAQRDGYQACYFRMADKRLAMEDLCARLQLQPAQCSYMYDDTIDMGVAAMSGVRILVGKPAAPVFRHYVEHHRLADYITALPPQHHAIREAMEMLLLLTGQAQTTLDARLVHNDRFTSYIQARGAMPWLGTFTQKGDGIAAL